MTDGGNEKVRIETFTMDRLVDVNKINNAFTGGTGKRCCCCISCGCCPDSDKNFQNLYRRHPEALELGAVAIRRDTEEAIGAIVLNIHGIPCSENDAFMHTTKAGEAYVSWLAVNKGNRGQGAGTALLKWAVATAKRKGATRMTLGVLSKNPAIRLYERFGFERVNASCFDRLCSNLFICFIFGSPFCGFGGFMMEKPL
eukprot:g5021.t1